jgi:hypothetical protein
MGCAPSYPISRSPVLYNPKYLFDSTGIVKLYYGNELILNALSICSLRERERERERDQWKMSRKY